MNVSGWEEIYHANGKHKNPGVAIIISGKKKILRQRKETYNI